MCIVEESGIPIYDQQFMELYTLTIWIINLFILLCWILELIIIRNIFRCSSKRIQKLIKSQSIKCKFKFPAAFIMILLSTLTSFLSSTFFLRSSFVPSTISCSYSPIIAILFRFLSKHFIWGFNIVRGQMVIEMLENRFLNKFVKNSPYILTTQMMIIFGIFLIFSDSYYDEKINECKTDIPLLLIISIAFIGELLYGIVFVYIFFKAMTTSMERVINALRDSERQKTKKQLIHHLIVYLIQFLLSSLYIISIATCSNKNTFTSFDIFELELLISNICVLTLFRGRRKWCKKHCICYLNPTQLNHNRNKNEIEMAKYFEPKKFRHHHNNNIIDTTPNRGHPVLLPTSSNQCDDTLKNIKLDHLHDSDEKENNDILESIQELQLSDTRNRINSISPRNNSISVNPLLPNSWLSPRSILTFKTTINERVQHQHQYNHHHHHQKQKKTVKSFSTSHLMTRSESMTSFGDDGNIKKEKHDNKHKASQSAFILERYPPIKNTHFIEEEKEYSNNIGIFRSKSMVSAKLKKKTKFERGRELFILNIMNIDSHSTPFPIINNNKNDLNDLNDLSSAMPIPAILSQQDNFKYISNSMEINTNNKEEKRDGNSLEIVYNDNAMTGNTALNTN